MFSFVSYCIYYYNDYLRWISYTETDCNNCCSLLTNDRQKTQYWHTPIWKNNIKNWNYNVLKLIEKFFILKCFLISKRIKAIFKAVYFAKLTLQGTEVCLYRANVLWTYRLVWKKVSQNLLSTISDVFYSQKMHSHENGLNLVKWPERAQQI